MNKKYVEEVIEDINKYYGINIEKFEPFYGPVDLKLYPNYPNFVSFETNLAKILKRLSNLYYRHRDVKINPIVNSVY